MVSLLNSQGIKSCKSRESFCLSILTIYTNDWSTFDTFTGAMFISSSVKFLCMCKPKTGWLTLIGILWKWASKPTKLVGDGECRLTRFHSIRNFLANDIYHFSRLSHQTGCLFNLLSHFCLFQNAILHEMMKLGFRNFKPIFLRMQFSLVATFFFSSFGYQFELIFASYN